MAFKQVEVPRCCYEYKSRMMLLYGSGYIINSIIKINKSYLTSMYYIQKVFMSSDLYIYQTAYFVEK